MMISQPGTEGPVVQLEMRFRAPRPKIWQVWTEPDLLRRWHLADEGYRCTTAEVDLTELGPFRLVVEPPTGDGSFEVIGNYVEIVPEQRLVYTWAAMADPRYWTLVTVELSDDGPGSRLALAHGIFRDEHDRIAHEQGWYGCLSQLAKLLDEELETAD